MHSREIKQQKNKQKDEENKIDWFGVLQKEDDSGIHEDLLSQNKGATLRGQLIDFVVQDLSIWNGKLLNTNVPNARAFWQEIGNIALQDTKHKDVIEKAIRAFTLNILWQLDDQAEGENIYDQVKEKFFDALRIAQTNKLKYTCISSITTLYIMAPFSSTKEIDQFVENVLLPPIEDLRLKLDNDEIDEKDDEKTDADEEDDVKITNLDLIELYIRAAGALITFTSETIQRKLLEGTVDLFTALLEHPNVRIKVLAAQGIAVGLDLIQRDKHHPYKVDIKGIEKSLNRILYDKDLEWTSDKDKKLVQLITKLISEEDYTVEIPFITVKSSAYVIESIGGYEKWTPEYKTKDKKANAVTGFSDSFVIDYLNFVLKNTFAEMLKIFTINEQHSKNANCEAFTNIVLSIIARHPSAEEFSHHVYNLKKFGGSRKGYSESYRERTDPSKSRRMEAKGSISHAQFD